MFSFGGELLKDGSQGILLVFTNGRFYGEMQIASPNPVETRVLRSFFFHILLPFTAL